VSVWTEYSEFKRLSLLPLSGTDVMGHAAALFPVDRGRNVGITLYMADCLK
jgi:hypothetical protein